MEKIKIELKDCEHLIEDGDILLFRGKGIVSRLIEKYSFGRYSHVGIANWNDGNLMCLEMREFRGGRSVYLESQIDSEKTEIDVYKVSHNMSYKTYHMNKLYNVDKTLNNLTRQRIVNRMIEYVTGQPYGWSNIGKILLTYLPFTRLLWGYNTEDDYETKYHICSSAVSYCYRTEYIDLVPMLSDQYVTPNHISRSALLKYQFTLK